MVTKMRYPNTATVMTFFVSTGRVINDFENVISYTKYAQSCLFISFLRISLETPLCMTQSQKTKTALWTSLSVLKTLM